MDSPGVSLFDRSHEWNGALSTTDGLRLVTGGWRPQGPLRSLVVLVHGYAEHSGRYAPLAARLTARGHVVFTYDQRGFGRSEGRRAFIRSFDQYLNDLDTILHGARSAYPNLPTLLFGHSMGGAIATLYCLQHQPNLEGLILSSPAIKVSPEISPLLQKLSALIGRLFPRLPTIPLDRSAISHDPAVVSEANADPFNYHGRLPARTGAELIRATRRIGRQMEKLTLPLLLFHGTDDRLTDPAGSTELYSRTGSTDKTIALYPGLYHETFNEPEQEQVYEEILDWLDEHV